MIGLGDSPLQSTQINMFLTQGFYNKGSLLYALKTKSGQTAYIWNYLPWKFSFWMYVKYYNAR